MDSNGLRWPRPRCRRYCLFDTFAVSKTAVAVDYCPHQGPVELTFLDRTAYSVECLAGGDMSAIYHLHELFLAPVPNVLSGVDSSLNVD